MRRPGAGGDARYAGRPVLRQLPLAAPPTIRQKPGHGGHTPGVRPRPSRRPREEPALSASRTSSHGEPGAPASPATPRQLFAWALYDWANSPFFAVILTFVFATYFSQAVAANAIDGTAQWGLAIGLSGVVIAVFSPIMGAIADIGGPRKPWLAGFTAICAVATALLWLVEPDPAFVLLALVLIFLANSALGLCDAFYNAMLPDLASSRTLGRWSGRGWAIGYIAGIAALVLLYFGVINRDPPPFGLDAETAEPVRLVGPVVALWLVVFALPLFLVTPDKPASGRPTRQAVRQGLGHLYRTLRGLGRSSQVLRFLVARLIYNDGLNTLFTFGGIYAAGTFGMTTQEILLFAIALNVSAGIGSFAFGYIDDRLGSKRTVLLALAGLAAFGIAALVAEAKTTFWVLGVLIGLFVGPAQSASRTLMARLAPPDQRTEMFGLYALSGKVTAFLGPFLFGGATAFFGTQRAGMAVVVLLIGLGGLLLLLTVREPAAAD
jgi:UMF1 family MFS transporter